MKRNILKTSSGFTLIELVVAITIFSVIMISVISIFIFSSELSGKIEIQRTMQENIKNVVETIAEDVRKYGISWVSQDSLSDCVLIDDTFSFGTKLCVEGFEYYIAKQDVSGSYIRVSDPSTWCSDIKDMCRIVKEDILLASITPLSNNFVTFRDFSLSLFWGDVPYLVIQARLQPTLWKWVRSALIEKSEIIFQTTLSERMIDIN